MGLENRTKGKEKFASLDTDVLYIAGVKQVPPFGGGGGGFSQLTVNVLPSDIDNLATTPVVIIPAPGAGKVVVPVFCVPLLVFGTSANWSLTGRNPTLYYQNDAGNTDLLSINVSNDIDNMLSGGGSDTALSFGAAFSVSATPILGLSSFQNQAIVLKIVSGSVTGSGDSTLRLIVFYTTITFP
jgi:hypothetical protein